MATTKSRSLAEDNRIHFRETPDVIAFYKKGAALRRVPLSDHVRTLTARGALAASIDDFVEMLHETVKMVSAEIGKGSTGRRSSVSGQLPDFPEEVYRAIFASHFMLLETLSPNDMTLKKRANDYATEEIAKLRGPQS